MNSELRDLPDATPIYVDGFGQATLGEARTSKDPPPDEDELTIRHMVRIMLEDVRRRDSPGPGAKLPRRRQ